MSLRAVGRGARFGLLLQLAVGPVCLFVFRTASDRGVAEGLLAVCGVAAVDAAYIALAGIGVTRWAERGGTRLALQYGGAAVIALFGADVLASAAGWQLLPALPGSPQAAIGSGSLLGAVLLTASNPLTIVFWAGVFGAKVAAERYTRRELWLFSAGCVAATVIFLTGVVLAGALLQQLAPEAALRLLNAAVGVALLYFALRLATRRATDGEER